MDPLRIYSTLTLRLVFFIDGTLGDQSFLSLRSITIGGENCTEASLQMGLYPSLSSWPHNLTCVHSPARVRHVDCSS